ncbi:MAG: isoprenyl transferase [Deltaproteobacteria bacterium]|nr:isoprenyl transferase [Deltaproteobacteria bacterium]MBW1922127.1 isoprenyl transferase [Deltaproteobacteria bacterium]MBW1947944.1 isoprenyl transferase [Deltaproteobacteria bacterium]MBW2007321.1 isoprenyl transferase [Deltaproteobacteria bacterium]MBW2102379.1 isoprenyl transferase [Deltaproteobacteria bacterium]
MNQSNRENLPRHVAVIMDGNGRWAKNRGLRRVQGHEEGARAVREVVRATRELGIPWLTLYAFSEENWKRSEHEVKALMRLLVRFLEKETDEMMENGIRLQAIGRLEKLPRKTRNALREAVRKTDAGKEMVLTLALSYGGRQEIADAVAAIARDVALGALQPENITEESLAGRLYTAGMPDPDLLVRTSGEFRISNFLLWQIAYTEIYVTPTLWPDFGRDEYLKAIADYQKRERRFGGARE